MPFSEKLCVIWIFFNCQTRERKNVQNSKKYFLIFQRNIDKDHDYIKYPTCKVLSYYSCLNTPYFIHLAIVTKHRYHHNGS